jgi:hypothetical protein
MPKHNMYVNWDQFFHLQLNHNTTIIQWLVVATLLAIVAVMALSIFGRSKGDSSGKSGDLGAPSDIEGSEFIKKLMAELPAHLKSAGAAGIGAGGPMSVDSPEVQNELKARTEEIEKLKAEVAKSKGQNADSSGLEKKIKDLEAKLSEYEILEDDIADLSLYKEENVRLKEELKKSMSGDQAAAAPEPEPDEAAAEPGSSVETATDLAAAAMADEPDEFELGPPPSTTAASSALPTDDTDPEHVTSALEASPPPQEELVDEFAKVMQSGKAEAAPAPVADGGDDLLTEFAASLNEPTAPATADPAADNLDTDKMLAEMADMSMGDTTESGLEDESDIDKMAAEATKLLGS